MDIIGLKELKQQLGMMMDNIEAYRIGAVKIPNFALNISRGNGQSTVAEYITDLLHKNKLRMFCGLDALLEYRLDGSLKQLKRVFEDIKGNAVYTNDFQGCIAIDVSSLSEYANEYQVDYFIEKIVEVSESATIIIFYDDSLGIHMEQVKNRVVASLGSCLDITSYFNTSDLTDIVTSIIIDRGINLEINEKMRCLLKSIIESTNVTSVQQAIALSDNLVLYADYSSFVPRLDSNMINEHISSIRL